MALMIQDLNEKFGIINLTIVVIITIRIITTITNTNTIIITALIGTQVIFIKMVVRGSEATSKWFY